ncbi:unnamed protein product [Cyclocybe aegerita]|uniref:Macro-like domain-containing protein n=1 Tax=Cyclocybe aegerita TaxID=1973307 RepID=A0A8S0WYD7_CYCAE|nr:unnamed protein product [Cyclocybe aegerita]
MSIPRFILIAPKPPVSPKYPTKASLCDAWAAAIKKYLDASIQPLFTVLEGKLLDLDPTQLQCDCMVSPANSFGIMDGGYDLELSRAFKRGNDEWVLTKHVQLALREQWNGYAPPSTCTIVPLPADMAGDGHNPWSARNLAVVPTMRTPEDVSWHQDLVYNSMWSLLATVARWNETHAEEKIERVLMTGLATGQGGFTVEKCAEQMMLAVKHFTEGLPEHFKWDTVIPRDEDIRKTYT